MGKWILVGVIVVSSSAIGLRAWQKRSEQLERDEQARRSAEMHVDLSALPDREPPSQPEEEAKIKKHLSNKPVIVNLLLKQKKGKKVRPFVGAYKVLNAAGETVSDGDCDVSGDAAVMILSRGTYDVLVPTKRFKYKLDLLAVESEKHEVTVIVGN